MPTCLPSAAVTVTCAPGISAPLGSEIWPWSTPVAAGLVSAALAGLACAAGPEAEVEAEVVAGAGTGAGAVCEVCAHAATLARASAMATE